MTGGLRNLGVTFVLAVLIFTSVGCKKKKPAVPAPQAEAPTITTPEPATPPATETPAPSTPAAEATTTSPAPPPKPKKPRTRAKKPSAGVPPATNGSTPGATVANNGTTPPPSPNVTMPSGKVVVPDGSVAEPSNQVSTTTMPTVKDNEIKLNTERSLQATEKDLKAIAFTPSLDQKSMMDQIKTYITQSRTANSDGDVLRASNLAQKARLLCDELLRK